MSYGLLSYSSMNLGDDVQSLAARQFLPRIDIFLDRDRLSRVASDEKIKVIMNGWFKHKPEDWPPSPLIDPLFISFHISPRISERLLTPTTIEYLKNYRVGCRDTWTRDLLKNRGIDAYFSGCLTLTLDYRYGLMKKPEREGILISDLDPRALKLVPPELRNHARTSSNYLFRPPLEPYLRRLNRRIRNKYYDEIIYSIKMLKVKNYTAEERRLKAEEKLRELAAAKLVITSRLHCALPSLAFGTPVLFVHGDLDDPRFSGLLRYMNHYTIEDFGKLMKNSDLDDLPENPNRDDLEMLRGDLIKTVKNFINC